MKGTYIKVINDVVFDELDKLKNKEKKLKRILRREIKGFIEHYRSFFFLKNFNKKLSIISQNKGFSLTGISKNE